MHSDDNWMSNHLPRACQQVINGKNSFHFFHSIQSYFPGIVMNEFSSLSSHSSTNIRSANAMTMTWLKYLDGRRALSWCVKNWKILYKWKISELLVKFSMENRSQTRKVISHCRSFSFTFRPDAKTWCELRLEKLKLQWNKVFQVKIRIMKAKWNNARIKNQFDKWW